MLLKLSIEANSLKGQNLRKDGINSDVDDPKKGIISDSTCCSCLVATKVECMLKCCTCDEYYHSACINRPISSDLVTTFNENPNCWWTCLHCLLTLPVIGSKPNNIIDPPNVSTSQNVAVDLHNFKAELLNEMRSLLIDNQRPLMNKDNQLKRKRDDDILGSVHTPKQRKTVQTYPTATTVESTSFNCNDITIDVTGDKNSPVNQLIREVRHQQASRPSHNSHTPCSISSSVAGHSQHVNDIQQPDISRDNHILHFQPITTDLAIQSHEDWRETRKLLSKRLGSIKVSFSRFNIKNGRVKIGFPTHDLMNKAKEIICTSPDNLWSYENYTPSLLLPKLTVYNVPLDFDLPSDESASNLSGIEFRDTVKDQLINTIINKNETVKCLIDNNNATLEVIYVQKHKNSCTAALKVSSNLREHILNKLAGKLYVFSARCNVEDRFFYKQCFHCQALGHISKDCPYINAAPVCMYCSASHRSSACPVKYDQSKHCCSNCTKSTDPTTAMNAPFHNAASRHCPIAISFMDAIRSRTQISDPKNS